MFLSSGNLDATAQNVSTTIPPIPTPTLETTMIAVTPEIDATPVFKPEVPSVATPEPDSAQGRIIDGTYVTLDKNLPEFVVLTTNIDNPL